VIFSRNRAGRHTTDSKERNVRGRDPDPEELEEDEPVARREFGPYDASEVPDGDAVNRLDLGALKIPTIVGVDIQMHTGADGVVQQVMLVHGESRLQLAACAAPRSEGIWDELRETLRTSMAQSGARQEDTVGDYGPEIKARLRDGSSTVDIRHVGIDGPRWFVHAVFIGEAAADPSKAGPLVDVLRGLVVDRGTDAMPVGESLPLRLPPQAAADIASQMARAGDADAPAASEQPAATPPAGEPTPSRPATNRPTRTSGRGTPARGTAGRGASRQA
jgi:Protein of unknown function (DUF3710)